jgi:hypothetical protein
MSSSKHPITQTEISGYTPPFDAGFPVQFNIALKSADGVIRKIIGPFHAQATAIAWRDAYEELRPLAATDSPKGE